MRLVDLAPRFVRYETKQEVREMVPPEYRGMERYDRWIAAGRPVVKELGERVYLYEVKTVDEAEGIQFLCPMCFTMNKGAVGTHTIEVTFAGRNVMDHVGSRGEKGPTRWTVSGDSFENLSTTPSILLSAFCGWHGYITDGELTFVR